MNLEQISQLSADKGRIAFVSGKFNILHSGHVRLLHFAKEISDYLVVGVLGDETQEGLFLPEADRLMGVLAVSSVDAAFLLRVSPVEAVKEIRPEFVVKGKEHEQRENLERAIVEEYGGKLLFGSGDSRFSTLSLINFEIQDDASRSIHRDYDYEKRHDIDVGNLTLLINKMKELNILVLGETIMDEYIDCQPIGMSAEDPTLVVSPIEKRHFLGGAGVVAAHAAKAAAQVNFISVLGDDEIAELARNLSTKYEVRSQYLVDASRPTTNKRRFRADGKTLLRVNDLRDHEISKEIQDQICENVSVLLPNIDLLMFADFNYGILPQELVSWVIEQCSRWSIPVVADSQSSSQVGNISRYKKCFLVSPTEREARIATRNYRDGLVILAEELRRIAQIENVVITLGAEGVLVHAGEEHDGWIDDRIPALNHLPRDVAGAGDALFVYTSLCLAVGGTLWESTYLGSMAAASQVSRVGNIPLIADELIQNLSS